MPHRRIIAGQPLLVVSTGALIAACSGIRDKIVPPVGNLMQPATVSMEICVDPQPTDAKVMIYQQETTERCTHIDGQYGSIVPVTVSADGYYTKNIEVPVQPAPEPLSVTLLPIKPELQPVGNLMPPPKQ